MRRLLAWVRRPRHLAALAALVLLLVGDYALYPRLAPAGGQSRNTGQNGLWLRYTWYFGRRTNAEARQMARDLAARQIQDAYFHVRFITRKGRLRFHYPASARRLVATLRQHAPGARALAWVYAGNPSGRGEVDLSRPAVRREMVREAVWLTTVCGFDGVQWDYEICPDRDQGFLALMRETRAALPHGKILSTATPVWLPRPVGRWGWSEEYYAQVAATCDQVAVMIYDSGIYSPRLYAHLVRLPAVHDTRAGARGNPRCRVLLGLPTYGRAGPAHDPHTETLRVGLKGVREGLGRPDAERGAFAGVALFADYTTQPAEWETYARLWRH